MNLTVHIPDADVPALKEKASGIPLETFAEQVLLERIHGGETFVPDETAPIEEASGMVEENGLRVYRTGKPMPVELINEVIRQSRDERMLHLIGNLP